jgi:hypothetical protein
MMRIRRRTPEGSAITQKRAGKTRVVRFLATCLSIEDDRRAGCRQTMNTATPEKTRRGESYIIHQLMTTRSGTPARLECGIATGVTLE